MLRESTRRRNDVTDPTRVAEKLLRRSYPSSEVSNQSDSLCFQLTSGCEMHKGTVRVLTRRQFAGGLAAVACSTAALPDGFRSTVMAASSAARSMTELQQGFVNLRFGMYIHLNMATFEQREWGDPKASPEIFNPKRLDTDQWARAAQAAGMTYGCLTTKHHDGFCLWPTATSSPSVKDSAFKHDIVRAYADSFRQHGLKVCLYFSILDLRANIRHFDVTREKIEMIKAQLAELLTNYGEITALIIDGWDAAWSRLTYEEVPFREIYAHVKKLQPNCLMSDYNQGSFPAPVLYYTDIKQYEQHAGQTIPAGSIVPSQSATTLQSDWFWKEEYPTSELQSAAKIVNEWLVPFNQRNCNLILNVAPNREGRFDRNALDRLTEIGNLWKERKPVPPIKPCLVITTENLACGRPSLASSSADTSGPDLANDNNPHTYWIADEGQTGGWIEIDLKRPTEFNTVAVIEPVYLQWYGSVSRITSFKVEAYSKANWFEVLADAPREPNVYAVRTTVAERIRLIISGTTKPPGIAEFGIYSEPERR